MRGVEQIPWMYDTVLQAMEWGGLGNWRRWLAGGARGRTLDLGCGTGRNLPHLPAGTRVVGLDPCPQSLARARRRAPHALLVRGRAEALPFRDGAFDTVVSGFAFCSVPDPAAGLAEVRRVLARGGALRMLEHVRSGRAVWARLQDWIQPAWTAVTGGCHPNRDTERAVEGAGFGIEEDGRRASESMRRFQARPLDLP
jgi:ubiquinone/menaquinone biosynthesis C-methylase UbiE